MPNLRLPTDTQNAVANRIAARIDEGGPGKIRIYDGDQPDSPNEAIDEHVLLAELTFSARAFKEASFGTIIANPIPLVKARASGDATWARIANGAGKTVFDCDVAKRGALINLSRTDLVEGGIVMIESFSITQPG